MDELEILKKDWQKEDSQYPKLSFDEIYRMILKKSSSIVKWIFIISVLEFVLWTVLSFGMKDNEAMQRFRSYNVNYVLVIMNVISYSVLGYFLFRFFMNYRRISVTDNAQKLMKNILRTRQTVRQYVFVNIGLFFVSTLVVLFIQFNKDEELISTIETASANGEILKFYAITAITTLLILGGMIGLLIGFYYLIYGLLLRKLNRNYKELKKFEI